MMLADTTDGLRRFATHAMGSPLRLTIAADGDAACDAWELVRRDVELTEAALSRFRTSSALTLANRHAGDGSWHEAPPRLVRMAALVRRAHRVTGGLFDPRVIARLEALGERAGIDLPTGASCPDPWIEVDPRAGRLRLGVPIDSGGIGKGLALRWALRAVRRVGLAGRGGLLEAGGDIVTWGIPSTASAWRVAIEDPAGADLPVAAVDASPGAVVTSSVRIRRWRGPDGRTVHHLIDPRTGEPSDGGLLAVTVACPDPAWAEVVSKHLFLMGSASIARDADARNLVAWWTLEGGELRMSRCARARTVWTRPGSRPTEAAPST